MSGEIPLTNEGLCVIIGPFLPVDSTDSLRQLHWQLGLEEVSSHAEIPVQTLEAIVIEKARGARYRLAEYRLAFDRRIVHSMPGEARRLLTRK